VTNLDSADQEKLKNTDSESGDDSDTLLQSGEELERAVQLSRKSGQPPAVVRGYRISKCLGEGAYGSVWLAREENTGKQVAIKFYTFRRGLDWSLLNREVEKLAVLYTSRNIVGLLDVGWDSDPPYYIMEYLENLSLESFLASGPLPAHEAIRIAKGVLQALVHAHGCGILHCDLKPANVLLDADFDPRLCDFGQSRLSTEQNPALGTLFYMAPEQADLTAVPDARWDVYALGALLYHMLCGEPPHRDDESKRRLKSADSLEERLEIYREIVGDGLRPQDHRKVSGVDKRLADIVDRCLHPDPKKRFPNAQAVLDVLAVRDRQRSRRPLIALGIVGPMLLLAGMAFMTSQLMGNAAAIAEKNLVDRTLAGAVVPVSILAQSVERELEQRKSDLAEMADDQELRSLIQAEGSKPYEQRTKLVELLSQFKNKEDRKRTDQGREKDISWFLTDGEGFQKWREPFDPGTLDKNWAHRDYFHGRNTEYQRGHLPADLKPLSQPHISLAFRSKATNQYMVAVSVPVWDLEHQRVIGVLARTTHLSQLLSEYAPSIKRQEGDRPNRIMALVDSRNWKLLAHDWMNEENLKNSPESVFEQLELKHAQIERLSKFLRTRTQPTSDSLELLDRDDNYFDPVASVDESFDEPWLAAFAPVGNLNWLAIVQERKRVALEPVYKMRADMLQYSLWALLVGGALVITLWYFVFRALSERRLPGWTRNTAARQPTSITTISDL